MFFYSLLIIGGLTNLKFLGDDLVAVQKNVDLPQPVKLDMIACGL